MDLSPEAVRAWRERLATVSDDVFEIMEASIAVAAQYRSHDFLRRKALITERLLVNPGSSGGDNFTTADSEVAESSETVQGPLRVVPRAKQASLIVKLKLPAKQIREGENAAERPTKQSSGKTEYSVTYGEGEEVASSKTGSAEKGSKALLAKKEATKRKTRKIKENSKKLMRVK